MAAYSFIDNINSLEGIKELCTRFSALRQQYNRYKKRLRHDMLVKKTKSVKLLISIPNYWSA